MRGWGRGLPGSMVEVLGSHSPDLGEEWFSLPWALLQGRPSCDPSVTPPARYPNSLQCVNINISSDQQCQKAYPGAITPGMVCAGVPQGGKDSCQVRRTVGAGGGAGCRGGRWRAGGRAWEKGVVRGRSGPFGAGTWVPKGLRGIHEPECPGDQAASQP